MPRHRLAVALAFCLVCSHVLAFTVPEHARHGKLYSLIQADLFSDAQPLSLDRRHTPAAQWFHQRLDHIASDSNTKPKTFPQRFYEEDAHWTAPNGPVILYIGGEGPLEQPPFGFVHDLARAWGAKILALEHRFYGKSVPDNDLSTENLRYLSVEQALADLAYFQAQFQAKMPVQGNLWVAVGGSYPGALAAWFRVAYPNVTLASLSSSGVVLPVYEFSAFDEQVALSAGEQCADVLRRTTAEFEKSLADGNTTVKALFGAEKLADADFFYMLADAAAMAVQYGHKDVVCTHMEDADQAGASLVDAFAAFTTEMYGSAFGHGCFYDTKCLADDGDPGRWPEGRSWRWQKCSQLAYFQIAPANGSLRSAKVDLAYHNWQCRAIFGNDTVHPEEGVKKSIEMYGGLHPKTHRVFFSNGGDDPWQRASIVKTQSDDLIANLAVCDSCGHCGDLRAAEHLPTPLMEQRKEIMQVMTKWIEDYGDQAMNQTSTAAEAYAEIADGQLSSVWIIAAAITLATLSVVARFKLIRTSPSKRLNYGYLRLDSEE